VEGWSTGYKTNLLMRAAYPETLQAPISEAQGSAAAEAAQNWFSKARYGSLSFMTTVSPVLVLPHSEIWYVKNGGIYGLINDARVAAKLAGFDPANFDFDTVVFNENVPNEFGSGWAGMALIRAKGCWLKMGPGSTGGPSNGGPSAALPHSYGELVTPGVAGHEWGHNPGLRHAASYDSWDGSITGYGASNPYGNPFDIMGGGTGLGAFNKHLLGWLPDSAIQEVTSSGTYRIYPNDQFSEFGSTVCVKNPEEFGSGLLDRFHATDSWESVGSKRPHRKLESVTK